MREDLFDIISEKLNLKDVDVVNYSPLTLAYIGDAVYELVIRTIIVDETNRSVNNIHKMSSSLVNAKAQAKISDVLLECFDEEELAVFKRGRNAKINTKAKNASYSDYKKATGLEALIGWLYLNKKTKRLLELIDIGINNISD